MRSIIIEITGNIAKVIEKPSRITSGTVGLPVEFVFDSLWDGLDKTAVFRAGYASVVVDNIQDNATVPWEVLRKPNVSLSIGVYGVNKDGTVAIPTTWAKVSVIKVGTVPDGEPETDPHLPVYKQLQADVEAIRETDEKQNKRISDLENRPISTGGEPLIVIYETQSGKASHTSTEIYEASLQRPVMLDHSRHQEYYQLNYCNEFRASFVKLGDDRLYEEWIVDGDGDVEYFNHGFIANTEQLEKAFGYIDAAVGEIEATIGDIDSALDELHAYAQALIGGEVE